MTITIDYKEFGNSKGTQKEFKRNSSGVTPVSSLQTPE